MEEEGTLDVECQDTQFNRRIKNELIHTIGEYKAPSWYNPHIAIMIPFGHDYRLQYEKQLLFHQDGSYATIFWYPHKPPVDSTQKKICILLPCLGGVSNDKYVQNFAVTMWSKFYYTVIVSARGKEMPLINKKAWHPGFADDALLTLRRVYKDYEKNAPCPPRLFMTGFSAGTTILFRTLLQNQESQSPIPVLGACVVCIIGKYVEVRDDLEKSALGRFYSYCMASKHKDIVSKNAHIFEPDEMNSLLRCTNLREFDVAACKILYGFHTEEEIKDAFSCLAIRHLKLPILGIQPADDPLHNGTAKENNRVEEIVKENSQFIYVETKRGSHIGFFESDTLFEAFTNKVSYTYPTRCAILFFEAILDEVFTATDLSKETAKIGTDE